MQVQRAVLPNTGRVTWMVLDNNYLPIRPITTFLAHLENIERSPNTIRAYAYHLKLFWEYLKEFQLEWTDIGLDELGAFVHWLRFSYPTNIIPISHEQTARRGETTVNAILASVSTLYDYHERTGTVKHIPMFRTSAYPHKRYKRFLHHISKGKPIARSTLRLRERARLPATVTREQVQQLIEACPRHRDKFLIALMDETGMRVGQALGLRHEDIVSWENLIHIVPRSDNANGARSKCSKLNTVHVSKELMERYKNYLVYELEGIVSDYVFINLWDGPIGRPMQYSSVAALFHRLSKKIDTKITPHMLRHTHATEMLRACGNLKAVQERLGHSNLQSTEIYLHLINDDLKQAHQKFLNSKREKAKVNE